MQKIIILFFLALATFSLNTNASDSLWQGIEQASNTETGINTLDLAIAKKYKDDNPSLSRAALISFIQKYDRPQLREAKENIDGIPRQMLIDMTLNTNPDFAKELYANYLRSFQDSIDKLTVVMKNNPGGILDRMSTALSFRHKKLVAASDKRVKESLFELEQFILNADVKVLKSFQRERALLVKIYNNYLEAKIKQLNTVEQWSKEIEREINCFLSNATFIDHGPTRAGRMAELYYLDRDIEVFRAYVNRQTISAGAMATLVAAQGFCTIATFGICATTIPATTSWAMKSGELVITGAKIVVAGNAAANIVDRLTFDGIKGLLNIATAMDTLLILSIMPRPSTELMASQTTYTIFGQTIGISDLMKNIAFNQQRATYLLSGVVGGFGLYQISYANEIAATWNMKNPVGITASQIRLQGIVHAAIGILGGLSAYNHYAKNLANSPEYAQYLAAKDGVIAANLKALQKFSPAQSLGNVFNGILGLKDGLWNGTKLIATGVGYGLYQGIASGTLAFISYGYPDFLMRQNSKPLPDLRNGEIALLLNGFANNDILYYAFATEFANRFEMEKYGYAKGRLQNAFFNSPKDFIEKIRDYAHTYGKIRYLKIMAHGIPGHIIPVATNITGGAEYTMIDSWYLEHNSAWIKEIARDAFAPDAQIVIVSCLVGGNYPDGQKYKDMDFEPDVGDRFINNIGNNLLVNGGTIDSSKRVILGLDASVGPLLDGFFEHGFSQNPDLQKAVKVELSQFRQEMEDVLEGIDKGKNENPGDIFGEADTPDQTLLIKGVAERMFKMYFKIWTLAYTFGYAMDGGLFGDRHRQDVFPPQ